MKNYKDLPMMSDATAEKLRARLIEQKIIIPGKPEPYTGERNRAANKKFDDTRPCMLKHMVVALKERLIKAGLITPNIFTRMDWENCDNE